MVSGNNWFIQKGSSPLMFQLLNYTYLESFKVMLLFEVCPLQLFTFCMNYIVAAGI